VETDDRADIVGEAAIKHIRDDDGRLTWEGGVELLLRPSSAAEVELSLAAAHTTNETAWADIAADRNGIDRSVFGSRDISELEMTLRGSLVFTHDLTLQAYGQFFFAKGRYDDFRYLERSSALLPFEYAGQADFNETSLQSNIVLRWEYMPGSTLFAVWSHSRKFEEGGGYRRTFAQEWDRTFLVPPDNIFMVKISYLLSGR